MLADLKKKLGEEAVEGRSLPLGDVLWVWQPETPHCWPESIASQELIAGWILERKTFADLSSSIMDGRYDEQKLRLLEAPGLEAVFYLVEGSDALFGLPVDPERGGKGGGKDHRFGGGFGFRVLNRMLPMSTLSTTAVHIQILSGFHVVHTTSTSHTVASLVGIHRAIEATGMETLAKTGLPLQTYRSFAERTRKSCHQRVFEAFGRMLRVVPHCGPEATEALVDEFHTPQSFAAALRNNSDTDLLLRLKARQRGARAPVSAAALAACRELFT
uniref:Crossover junction endonuclease MUS81 n=1 Tax=Crypthecodinium cohnii TaxID=2866 RepID=A0A516AGL4_CRYCO|nr:crossover junction endonuclease MUS81 [Crypthecodinium cohnii]